jgi:outer membrane protein TolC
VSRALSIRRAAAAAALSAAAALLGQARTESPTPSTASPTPAVLTIGEAVRRALLWNPDLRDVLDALRAAEVNEAGVRSTFLPQVTPFFSRARADESGSIAESYGLTMSEQLPFGPRIEGRAVVDRFPDALSGLDYGSSYRLTLTQPLLGGADPAVTREPLRQAVRGTETQSRAVDVARRRTVLLVYQLYLGLARQQEVVRLQQERAGRAAELAAFSRGRFAAGTVSKLDVYRAEQQEAASVLALTDAQTTLEDVRDALRRALDLPSDFSFSIERPTELPRAELPLDEAIDGVALRRPEAAEQRDRVQDVRFSVRIAKSLELPLVQGFIGYQSFGSGSSAGDAIHPRNSAFLWGFSSQYGLNSGVLRAQRRSSEIELGTRERNLALLEEDLTREVRREYRRLDAARRNHQTAAQNVRVAELQAEVARLRYEKGLSDNFNVVDADNLLNSARLEELDSRIEILLAGMNCLYASGDFDLRPFVEQP